MRKSDYQRNRRAYWIAEGLTPSAAERRVVDDELAAKAAGVAWEPEETALLGRLILRETASSAWVVPVSEASLDAVWIVAQLQHGILGIPDNRLNTFRAMVDLWNAWGPDGTTRQDVEHELRLAHGAEGLSLRLHARNALHAVASKPWESKS